MTKELALLEARDRFDEIGIEMQFKCRNLTQAIRSYENSCEKCTMFRKCNGHDCSIEKAFLHNVNKYKYELGNSETRQKVEDALRLDP